MKKYSVNRNTWAKIGQILAIIGAILIILAAIFGFLGYGVIPGTYAFISLSGIVFFIIELLLGILILLFELDYINFPSHLIRGIVYVVLFFIGAGFLVLLGGIFYIIAEFVK